MVAAIIVQGCVIIALLAVLVVQARAQSPDLTALLKANAELCQRVQAPAQAVYAHAVADQPVSMPQPPEVDDDKAHWELRELTEDLLKDGLYEVAS